MNNLPLKTAQCSDRHMDSVGARRNTAPRLNKTLFHASEWSAGRCQEPGIKKQRKRREGGPLSKSSTNTNRRTKNHRLQTFQTSDLRPGPALDSVQRQQWEQSVTCSCCRAGRGPRQKRKHDGNKFKGLWGGGTVKSIRIYARREQQGE